MRNNGGGVYNHYLYFDCMAPRSGSRPSGALARAIDTAFGSYEDWKTRMKAAAVGQFGSGYAWLVCDSSRCVSVVPVSYTHLDVYKRQGPAECWRRATPGR